MHRHLTTLPASTTIAELRAYFAASGSRRLALFVDGERYAGCLMRTDLPDDDDGALADHQSHEPVARAGDPAAAARDKALAHPSRRTAVIDEAGALVGIVAINGRLDGFCGA
jgi:CBS domain